MLMDGLIRHGAGPQPVKLSEKGALRALRNRQTAKRDAVGDAVPVTHRGGPGDTPWLQFGDGSRRRLGTMLAASVLAHAFLTPGPALLGLVAMLPALEIPDSGERLIPIELTSLPIALPAPEPVRSPEPPAAPPEAPAKAPEPPASQPETAPAPVAEKIPVPPATDSKVVESTPFADPVALSGAAASIVDSNADIRLVIFGNVIRDHPLGPRVSDLLQRTPQWKDFFGPSSIDPIKDVDRVLLAGPDFRDSSEVVAVVQHHLPSERIDQAFDALVKRSGKWIDRRARLASARADRAARLFSAPNNRVVVVAPPQLEKQLRSLGSETRFPETDGRIALSAYIIKPHYAAKGTGIVLPKSIRWARLDLRPAPDGGGVLHVLAQEKDEAAAEQTAALLQALIEQATSVDLSKGGALGGVAALLMGSKKVRMIQSVQFQAEGSKVRGTLVATQNQLLTLADLIGAYLPAEPQGASPLPSDDLGIEQIGEVDAPSDAPGFRSDDVNARMEKPHPHPPGPATAAPLGDAAREQKTPDESKERERAPRTPPEPPPGPEPRAPNPAPSAPE